MLSRKAEESACNDFFNIKQSNFAHTPFEVCWASLCRLKHKDDPVAVKEYEEGIHHTYFKLQLTNLKLFLYRERRKYRCWGEKSSRRINL